MDIRTLYYDKFLSLACEVWRDEIKLAKPGHCMKVTGFAMEELRCLYPLVKNINKSIDTYILSEEETGEEYIHATKLIELRNDESKGLLVLVPVNNRAAAEDSYGDATFKNLSASSLLDCFLATLRRNVPDDKEILFRTILEEVGRAGRLSDGSIINYLLYLELNEWRDDAFGEGLFHFGLLPDSKLTEAGGNLSRRLRYNAICVEILGDFSASVIDRVSALPIKSGTIQKELIKLLTNQDNILDIDTLCRDIHENHEDLHFSKWELSKDINQQDEIYVTADLVPGSNMRTELVRTLDGEYVLQIPPGKTSTVKVKLGFNPAPKKCDKIHSYSLELVKFPDFNGLGEIKKAKLPATTGGSKTVSIKIPAGDYDNGSYFLRAHVLDEDGQTLDTDNPFRAEDIQAGWEERHTQDPTVTKAQYQQEVLALTANDTAVFSIHNQETDEDEPTDDGDVDRLKRSHPDLVLQAYFHYITDGLRKNEDFKDPEIQQTSWKEGSLNDVFAFDFGSAYAYTIQVPKKLLEMERAFYRHSDELGWLDAEVSGNPTETKIQDMHFHALSGNIKVPEELIELRKEVFRMIQYSGASESGVLATFPLYLHVDKVEEYITAFTKWQQELIGVSLDEQEVASIPNIDTILMTVEMPDGSKSKVKLLPPFHPLRLAWMCNLFHLFKDWETRTKDDEKLRKQWYRKLDRLFMGELALEVAPLVLTQGALSIYQYVGELTFGWGFYALGDTNSKQDFSSENRQLKSYVASLLNITRDKQIDSDVTLALVKRHLENFVKSHPYSRKIVINLFNAGDANVFADALVALERAHSGDEYDYEIRLFADDRLIQPGSALKELLNPNGVVAEGAEAFAQASSNRLFPKLRFSINSINKFIADHGKYQAHISFLINPFSIDIKPVRGDMNARSFFLNGTLARTHIAGERDSDGLIWNRYFSNRQMPETITPFANEAVKLFSGIQYFLSKTLSSTSEKSVVGTSLSLNKADEMFLSFVHEVSDWVVTFDRNMGPEFYDLPMTSEGDMPYLLDYVPSQEQNTVSSFLTTRPTSEVVGLMAPMFKEFGVSIEDREMFMSLLEDVRTVSSSLVMQANTTQNKAFEVLGTTLTKRFLAKKHLMDEAFLIPIDLHKDLFEGLDSETKERADNLLVNIDIENREIIFSVIEIKCRMSLSEHEQDELEEKMMRQIENTVEALKTHFEIIDSFNDRLDRELKTLELADFLSFYAKRAARYNVLDKEIAHEYLNFLSELGDEYTLKFKKLGIIYNFSQHEKQKKSSWGETVFYSMGESVIQDILSVDKSLDTLMLAQSDEDLDFISFFEKNRKDEMLTRRRDAQRQAALIQDAEEGSSSVVPEITILPETKQPDISEVEPSRIPEESVAPVAPAFKIPETPEPENPERRKTEENYTEPKYDVLLGKNDSSNQFGILGKMANANRLIGVDLDGCNTFSLFGVQGAGKSYTIGSVVEMVMKQFSNVNKLPAPMAGVIFHYSDSMDYAPEFTSMTFPNDETSQLKRLKEVYGADAGSIEDIVLLTPESKVEMRKAEYPNVEVHPIAFDSGELQVKDWMFLLGAMGNDSAYLRVLTQIMRSIRNDLSLKNIRRGIKANSSLSNAQKELAEMRVSFAEEYIRDGEKLQRFLRPGRLIIVDLRDEFIQKDEALGLFVVMLNIFSSVLAVEGKRFNKFIVFDEAHKYMNNRELVGSISTAIREMRHKGVSVMIASQDPMSLPTEIIELSSMVILHRFNSPQWLKHVQKTLTALGSLTANDMSQLGSGEAYVWATKATDKAFTTHPVKIQIRPRVTKHGGDTIQAVK